MLASTPISSGPIAAGPGGTAEPRPFSNDIVVLSVPNSSAIYILSVPSSADIYVK